MKDPAAVRLGRKGGQARARRMTKEERSEASRKAALARWAKAKKEKDSEAMRKAMDAMPPE